MTNCEKEAAVLDAMRLRRLDEGLRNHLAECSVCADLVLTKQFMDIEAESSRRAGKPELPSPGLIWWKAQILSNRAVAERATRPIAIVEKAALACAALGLLTMLVWKWADILTWIAPLRTAWIQVSSQGTTSIINPLYYLGAGLFLLLILIAFTLYAVWVE